MDLAILRESGIDGHSHQAALRLAYQAGQVDRDIPPFAAGELRDHTAAALAGQEGAVRGADHVPRDVELVDDGRRGDGGALDHPYALACTDAHLRREEQVRRNGTGVHRAAAEGTELGMCHGREREGDGGRHGHPGHGNRYGRWWCGR